MDIVFRWAFGYNSYYWRRPDDKPLDERFFRDLFDGYRDRWSGSPVPEELFMLKLAIDSTQAAYPGCRYVLMDNSPGVLEEMMEHFSFRDTVEIIHKSDFESPFPFDPPESVWWKWVPLSMGDVDIFVDIDSIFIGKQTILPQWIDSDSWALFVRELNANKHSYKMHLVSNLDEHINVGLLGAKRNSPFSKAFLQASKSIPYSPNEYWSNFFAESECGNLAYHRMKSASAQRVKVVDGDVFTWWDSDFISPRMEWCHFLGLERKVAMMAFYSLLARFIELGESVTEIDKGILLTLTEFGTPRSLESSMPIIFSDVMSKHYNRLCLLYNVKLGERPPVDLIDSQSNIPDDAIFDGVTQEGNVVKATYRHAYKTYTVEGDIFGDLQVREEIK